MPRRDGRTPSVRELAQYRKRGDISSLEPKLRADVALHCMRLANRMHRLLLFRMRGWRFWKILCYKKAWKKYRWMYIYYDGELDDILNQYIGQVRCF